MNIDRDDGKGFELGGDAGFREPTRSANRDWRKARGRSLIATRYTAASDANVCP
jgi:hypothetical protein